MNTISQTLAEHVSNALEAHAPKENIAFEVTSIMGPDNQLCHVITLQGNSPIIGEICQAGGILMGAKDVTGEQVAQMVQSALETIASERTKALTRELPPNNAAEPLLITGSPKL